ncbi:hypothetical protein F4810DRAFT_305158 [Camillea tinctor]|nr:hypothetical protein F4810DRAFT_305158 [Camillea tinctor]
MIRPGRQISIQPAETQSFVGNPVTSLCCYILSSLRYRELWHTGCKSWLVRCNPKVDLLVIIGNTNLTQIYPHRGGQAPEIHTIDPRFPQDAHRFAPFRHILSSFRRVGINYALTGRNCNLLIHIDISFLLFHLESLEHLYAWPDPLDLTDAYSNGIKVGDILLLPSNYATRHWGDTSHLKNDSRDLLDDYARYSQIQIYYSTSHDEHWVPSLKSPMRVGAKVPRSWFQLY